MAYTYLINGPRMELPRRQHINKLECKKVLIVCTFILFVVLESQCICGEFSSHKTSHVAVKNGNMLLVYWTIKYFSKLFRRHHGSRNDCKYLKAQIKMVHCKKADYKICKAYKLFQRNSLGNNDHHSVK